MCERYLIFSQYSIKSKNSKIMVRYTKKCKVGESMKGYSKKVLVGVSFASLMLGSFQGGRIGRRYKGRASFISECAQNGTSWCTITSTRISSFIKST